MSSEQLPDFDEWFPDVHDTFSGIFKTYYRRMVHYACQFVKDRSISEDIVQSCFLKLWKKRRSTDFSRDISALLFTIVRNTTLDHLRANKHVESYQQSLELLEDTNRIQELVRTETLQEIYMISRDLPPKCRNVFELLYIRGMDHSEAAKAMQVAESTIRTQKARALNFIKLHLHRLEWILLIFAIC